MFENMIIIKGWIWERFIWRVVRCVGRSISLRPAGRIYDIFLKWDALWHNLRSDARMAEQKISYWFRVFWDLNKRCKKSSRFWKKCLQSGKKCDSINSLLRQWWNIDRVKGSMVKRLRHRPFTAVTGVQIPLESFFIL